MVLNHYILFFFCLGFFLFVRHIFISTICLIIVYKFPVKDVCFWGKFTFCDGNVSIFCAFTWFFFGFCIIKSIIQSMKWNCWWCRDLLIFTGKYTNLLMSKNPFVDFFAGLYNFLYISYSFPCKQYFMKFTKFINVT